MQGLKKATIQSMAIAGFQFQNGTYILQNKIEKC
jgi:hypothetical protein